MEKSSSLILRMFILTLLEAQSQGHGILFEGAQGTLLDVDHGTYPYVTSSSTICSGAFIGTGIGFGSIQEVIGIAKAYVTRVGQAFPTEIESTEPETAKEIRKIGQEYGATTGRPRRVGWLDLVALKYAVEVNQLTGIALMKVDVLNGFSELKLCTAYELDGKKNNSTPS